MPKSNPSRFYLSKWFFDCVNEKGEAAIVYAATIKWRGIEVPYNSILLHLEGGGVTQRSRFRNFSKPIDQGKALIISDPVFGLQGEWKADSMPLKACLFDGGNGRLDWHCLQPRAEVQLKLTEELTLKGWGYAEHLSLTIEPWKIPLDELRWGRYCTKDHHLVWIHMKSADSRQWVWYNGEPVANAEIEDKSIVLPDLGIKLQLHKGKVLEAENKIFDVVRSLLKYLAGFNSTMPSWFLNAMSYKWLSEGVLTQKGHICSEAWAIHEFVDFNKRNDPGAKKYLQIFRKKESSR